MQNNNNEIPKVYANERYVLHYNKNGSKPLFVICFNPTTFATIFTEKNDKKFQELCSKDKDLKSKVEEKRNAGICDSVVLDNTLKKIIKRSKKYDSFIFFNLIPRRSDNKKELEKAGNIEKNAEEIKNYIASYKTKCESIDILCAWGNILDNKAYREKAIESCIKIYESIKEFNCNYKRLDTDKKHPHHPAYYNGPFDFIRFDIKDYVKNVLRST